MPAKLKFKNIVIILVVIKILVFASFYFNFDSQKLIDVTDTRHYWGLAKSINENWTFTNNEMITDKEAFSFGKPNAFRLPVYPLFLSFFWNFGESGYVAVPVFQFIIGLFCVYFLFLITKRLFSEKAAKVAAIILLIEPTFLAVNYFILSDTLFILFLLIFIYQLILYFQKEQIKHLVLTSLFFAMAVLTRPVIMYAPIIVIFTFLYYYRTSLKIFIKKSLIFVLLISAFLSPWLIRNYLAFDKVFLTTLPSFNNWRYNIGFWSGGGDWLTVDDYRQKAMTQFYQDGREARSFTDLFDPANVSYYNQKTFEYIKENFGQFIWVQAYRMGLQTFDGRYFNYISGMYADEPYSKGFSQFFGSRDKWEFIRRSPELFIGSMITFVIFLAFLTFFILFFFKRPKLSIKKESFAPIIFLGLLVVYFYGTGAPGNTERYLLPLIIIEYIFFAFMLVNFRTLFNKRG